MSGATQNQIVYQWEFPLLLPYLDETQIQNATAGLLGIFWGNRRWNLQLTPPQKSAFAEAQQAGYLTLLSRAAPPINAWLAYCDLHAQPFLLLEPKPTWSHLTLEMGTALRLLNRKEVGLVLNLLTRSALRHHAQITFKATERGGTFRVPPSDAKRLAGELPQLLKVFLGTPGGLRPFPSFADFPDRQRRGLLATLARGLPSQLPDLLMERAGL